MKKLQLAALLMALSLFSVPLFSCSDDSTTPSISLTKPSDDTPTESNADDDNTAEFANKHSSGSHKNDSSFGQETEVNNTAFTLDSVVRVQNEDNDYIYIGVTIKNDTDTEYQISSLNNFFLDIGNGEELSPDIRAKQSALSVFPKCVNDPVTVPANGEFSGYLAGGFLVPSGTENISVGFFPTLDNSTDKSEFISIAVNPEDISDDVSALK